MYTDPSGVFQRYAIFKGKDGTRKSLMTAFLTDRVGQVISVSLLMTGRARIERQLQFAAVGLHKKWFCL